MHIQFVKMWLPRISIISRYVGLDKVINNETITLIIQQLCIRLNIKLNKKSRYVCIQIQPLSRCIYGFFYITKQQWFNSTPHGNAPRS
jgi:hypothetical protein